MALGTKILNDLKVKRNSAAGENRTNAVCREGKQRGRSWRLVRSDGCVMDDKDGV